MTNEQTKAKGIEQKKEIVKQQEMDIELAKLLSMNYANASYAIVRKIKNAKGGENIAIGYYDPMDRPIVNIIMNKEDALDVGLSVSTIAQDI